MREFLAPECVYEMHDGFVTTDGSVKRKITGTSFGAILGHNPWMSPFEASCHLLGLITEKGVGDKPAVRVGNDLELPIIQYIDRTYGDDDKHFIPAEKLNICAPRVGDHDDWEPDWEDEVFAGHIDGVMMDGDDVYIIDIKTARNTSTWTEGPPAQYRDQIRLYSWFLTQNPLAYIGVGFVTEETYRDSSTWAPSPDNVYLLPVEFDMKELSADIQSCREWYAEHIMGGTTVRMDPSNPRDLEIWDFLQAVNSSREEMADAVERLASLNAEIDAHDKAIVDIRKEADALKKALKDHMTTNDVNIMYSSTHDYVATVSQQVRTSFDESAMAKDGIDVERYRKTRTTNVFRLKKRK